LVVCYVVNDVNHAQTFFAASDQGRPQARSRPNRPKSDVQSAIRISLNLHIFWTDTAIIQ